MNIELLLQDITSVSKKYELIYEKTGGFFNVFSITDISTDELMICKVLYELLSPKGSHYQGSIYLEYFIKDVLKIDMSEKELSTATVYRERRIDYNRRIDLVIETNQHCIHIEVKIYAADQEFQCFDYAKMAKNSKVYYLTPYGDNPSEYSAKGLTKSVSGYDEVATISFSEDILNWLEKCVRQKETLKIAPIREVILQLIAVIRGFTNQVEDEKEVEIIDLLMKSSDNMRSALEIQSSLDAAKTSMIKKLLTDIEEKVKLEKLYNEYDYEFDNYKKVTGFYHHKYSTKPGISYAYKKSVSEDIDVWVRVEIDSRIFIGYCCPVNGKSGKQPLSYEQILNILKFTPRVADWWVYWEHLPNASNDCPNFKEINNEPYINLFDDKIYSKFIEDCAKRIKELLNR